jgi:hypothetical protein
MLVSTGAEIQPSPSARKGNNQGSAARSFVRRSKPIEPHGLFRFKPSSRVLFFASFALPDTEMDNLDRWAEDRRVALEAELDELDEAIKETKKSARLGPNLPHKLELQRKLRGLETKRDEAWRAYDSASRDVNRQKDALLDEIGKTLQQQTTCEPFFSLRWRVT